MKEKKHPGPNYPRGVGIFFSVRGTHRTHTNALSRGPLALEPTMSGIKTAKAQKTGYWGSLGHSARGDENLIHAKRDRAKQEYPTPGFDPSSLDFSVNAPWGGQKNRRKENAAGRTERSGGKQKKQLKKNTSGRSQLFKGPLQ